MTVKLDRSSEVLRGRFGAWLKAKREEAGLTQLDVAVVLDYAYSVAVSQIERGATALPAHDLKLWAKALRINQKEFGKQYAYHCHPFLYECLWGLDVFEAEELPRSQKTIKSAPGRRSPRRNPRDS